MTEFLTARQMRRARRHKERKPIDRTAERYMVYRLHDEKGQSHE